jgi:hypothetical protein
MPPSYKYDFFICHASEDKADVARPLAENLTKAGFRVWYDEYELTIGDSLRGSIDRGLATSRYGIVILSPSFFAKDWPPRELNGLVANEVSGRKVVLPVWHNVDAKYITRYSPTLADRYAVSTQRGLDVVVKELIHVTQSAEGGAAEHDKHKEEFEEPVEVATRGSSSTGLDAEHRDETENLSIRQSLILSDMAPHKLEDHAFSLWNRDGAAVVGRILKAESRALQKAVVDGRSVATLVGEEVSNKLLANPEESFSNAMQNVLPVWIALIDAELDRVGLQVSDELFRLYVASPSVRNAREVDPLNLQKQILFVVYAAGAYAIHRNQPTLARSFLGRTNPFDAYWQDRSWFRYVGTMLARRNEIVKTIIHAVKNYWSRDDYLADSLGGDKEVLSYLCQFDFLQCADIVLSGSELGDCFASFSVFRRHMVQPILEKFINTHDDGVWLSEISASACAQLIQTLDDYAVKWANFEYADWSRDRWSSSKIRLFLAAQGHEVR